MKRTGTLFIGYLLFFAVLLSCSSSEKYSKNILSSDIDYIYNSVFDGARLGLRKAETTVDTKYWVLLQRTKESGYEIEIYEKAPTDERIEAYDDSMIPVTMSFKFHNGTLAKVSCRWNRLQGGKVDGLNHHLSRILGRSIELPCRGDFCCVSEKVRYHTSDIYLVFTIAPDMEVLSISYEDDLI